MNEPANEKNHLIINAVVIIILAAAVLPMLANKINYNFIKKEIKALNPDADTSQCGRRVDGFLVSCTVDDDSYSIEKNKGSVKNVDGKKVTHTQVQSSSVFYGEHSPGAVSKDEFFKAARAGEQILNDLIRKGVLEEVSATEVRLRLNEGQSISRPEEIMDSHFDEIWHILQESWRQKYVPIRN